MGGGGGGLPLSVKGLVVSQKSHYEQFFNRKTKCLHTDRTTYRHTDGQSHLQSSFAPNKSRRLVYKSVDMKRLKQNLDQTDLFNFIQRYFRKKKTQQPRLLTTCLIEGFGALIKFILYLEELARPLGSQETSDRP